MESLSCRPGGRFLSSWASLHECQLRSPDQGVKWLTFWYRFPPTWPSLTTNIALQFLIVLSLWAMVMLVLPSWALSKALKTLLSLSVSKAEVASSSNRTGGFLINALAMAIRCFWPGSLCLITAYSPIHCNVLLSSAILWSELDILMFWACIVHHTCYKSHPRLLVNCTSCTVSFNGTAFYFGHFDH